MSYHHRKPSYLSELIQPHERSLKKVHVHQLQVTQLSLHNNEYLRDFRIIGTNEYSKLPFDLSLITTTLSLKLS